MVLIPEVNMGILLRSTLKPLILGGDQVGKIGPNFLLVNWGVLVAM